MSTACEFPHGECECDRPFCRFAKGLPVGFTVWEYWISQNREALDEAAKVVLAHGANPWVFSADERHFDQFAGKKEKAALAEMSLEALQSLIGHWE